MIKNLTSRNCNYHPEVLELLGLRIDRSSKDTAGS